MKRPIGYLLVFMIALGAHARPYHLYPKGSTHLNRNRYKTPGVPAHKTKLLVIRHGQTQENALRIVQGHLDVPLNVVGKDEAEAVARRLKIFFSSAAVIYSSDLMRAFDTAQAIGKMLDKGIQVTQDLRELQCGVVEGLSRERRKALYGEWKEKLDKLHPHHLTRWHYPDWPEGENKINLLKRVRKCIDRIALRHKGQTVIIVTHSGVLDTLIMSLGSPHYPIPNCSISHFWYDHSAKGEPLSFVKMEDYEGKDVHPEKGATAHL